MSVLLRVFIPSCSRLAAAHGDLRVTGRFFCALYKYFILCLIRFPYLINISQSNFATIPYVNAQKSLNLLFEFYLNAK